jgi:hypothetical protein
MSVPGEHRRSAKPDDATAANEDLAHIDLSFAPRKNRLQFLNQCRLSHGLLQEFYIDIETPLMNDGIS